MSPETHNERIGAALIIGGGIGGMQAALELAAGGIKVYLAESKPAIGGVMSQLDKTFPTNDCAMCTQAPRLVEIGRHKDIKIISLADIESVTGGPGNFSVTLRKRPRFVDEEKCTGCGTCVSNCPTRNAVQIIEVDRVELEPEFKERVQAIVAKHKNRKGPLMPILQEINSALNYFPETVLRYVSQETGYSLAHIYRIVTFYSSFSVTPRGKYAVNVCMGTACYVRGSETLMDKFSDALEVKPGETTPDRKFTLNSVRCIGCCGLAPAVMIGDQVYGKLTASQVPGIINKYREIYSMSKLTLEDLRKGREEAKSKIHLRAEEWRGRVIVHMGTCGLAAGARDVVLALLDAKEQRKITDVLITTSGCAGFCSKEPMITVELPGHAPVKYGNLTADKAAKIFEEHLLGGRIVQEYAIGVGSERGG